MPVNSKQKGARGEREAAKLAESFGFAARRGCQNAGGEDSPDIIVDELAPYYHFEVKMTQSFQLWNTLDQALRDKGDKQVPVLLHRKNNKPWVVVQLAEDWFKQKRKLLDYMRRTSSGKEEIRQTAEEKASGSNRIPQ